MEVIGLDEGLKRISIEAPTNAMSKLIYKVLLIFYYELYAEPGFTYRKSDKPKESYNFLEMMVSCPLISCSTRAIV